MELNPGDAGGSVESLFSRLAEWRTRELRNHTCQKFASKEGPVLFYLSVAREAGRHLRTEPSRQAVNLCRRPARRWWKPYNEIPSNVRAPYCSMANPNTRSGVS
jgi:hypothetical protein